MGLPFQPWRAVLQPASYAGYGFKVEAGGQAGGRRIVSHEFPKADLPFAEDMGRRAHRWTITGYLIGPTYLDDRDALIAALDAEGPSTLIHPTLGDNQAHCEGYSVTEVRERGGYCVFEMTFVEAGEDPGSAPSDDTAAQAATAADNSNGSAAAAIDAGLSGQTGGGVGGINAGAGSGDPLDGANGVMGGYPGGIAPGLVTGPNGFVVGGA